MKKQKQNRAITLIALIITVIILLILAGVSINFIFGNEGIFSKTQTAVEKYKNATEQEDYVLAQTMNMINNRETVTMSKDDLISLIKEYANPPGTILAYSAVATDEELAKSRLLKCEGQEVSRTTYKALFDVIGTTYGDGDGSTTFKLPDLRGEFLRGTGTNLHTNQGSGGTVGEHQDSTEISSVAFDGYGIPLNNPDTTRNIQLRCHGIAGEVQTRQIHTIRPTNTSVLYCIKY